MVGTSADDPDIDPVLLVPACVTVDDVDSIASVQIVDRTLSIDPPDLRYRVSIVLDNHSLARDRKLAFRDSPICCRSMSEVMTEAAELGNKKFEPRQPRSSEVEH